jgi:hypothetical protein
MEFITAGKLRLVHLNGSETELASLITEPEADPAIAVARSLSDTIAARQDWRICHHSRGAIFERGGACGDGGGSFDHPPSFCEGALHRPMNVSFG